MSFAVIKVSKSRKVKVALLRKVGETKLKALQISPQILMVIGVKTIAQITLEVDVNLSRCQSWAAGTFFTGRDSSDTEISRRDLSALEFRPVKKVPTYFSTLEISARRPHLDPKSAA